MGYGGGKLLTLLPCEQEVMGSILAAKWIFYFHQPSIWNV